MIGFLITLAAAAQLTATPVLSPLDLYKHAVSAMRAVQDPPYLRFDVEERFTHGAKTVQFVGVELERTQDRSALLRLTNDQSARPKHLTLSIPPDVFLNRAGQEPLPASGLVSGLDAAGELKTIAAVQAIDVHYTIDSLGEDVLPDGSSADHLKLQPTQDPLRYNLRELWIDPATFRLRRAVAIWRAPMIAHAQDVPVTLDLDSQGFVERWHLAATARMLLGSYSLEQETSYGNITASDQMAWSSFDGS
jgi:hypothetical protein